MNNKSVKLVVLSALLFSSLWMLRKGIYKKMASSTEKRTGVFQALATTDDNKIAPALFWLEGGKYWSQLLPTSEGVISEAVEITKTQYDKYYQDYLN